MAKKVKFSVDMTGQMVAATGVHIFGDFQTAAGYTADYDPAATEMTNESGNIYSVVVDIPAFRKYEFKFLNGNLSYDAAFVPLELRVLYGDDGNRWLYIDSTTNDTTFAGAILFVGNAPINKKLLRY